MNYPLIVVVKCKSAWLFFACRIKLQNTGQEGTAKTENVSFVTSAGKLLSVTLKLNFAF